MKTWKQIIDEEREKDYFKHLHKFIDEQYKKYVIYPEKNNIFRALELTPFESVKVVLIGQDPYHGRGQAHGLSFSVNHGIKIPPSLINIYKEISSDFGCNLPMHGCLENWAKQGILLLNTTLTVREGSPMSHADKGWESLTLKFIRELSENENKIIFLLLGRHAQQFEKYIDTAKNHIVKTSHPSPLGAYKGFIGSKVFAKINDLLVLEEKTPINWTPYKAVVFDLDGTLIDTTASLHKSVNDALISLGFSEISREKVIDFVGDGIDVLIRRVLDYCHIDMENYFDITLKKVVENLHKYSSFEMNVYYDFKDVLNKLKKAGFILGVYTNKVEEVAKKIIENTLPDIFDFVIGNKEIEKKKPDILYLGKTIGKMGVDLRDVIYVGDSETDIKTGRNGRMKTIAVSWGFRKIEELKKYNPDIIIDRPDRLLSEIAMKY